MAGSLWSSSHFIDYRRPLLESTQADVCVIGAGIAGLTTAYLLAREGKSVVVLESGRLGDGVTGRTTAHLTNVIDDRFSRLERMRGVEASHQAADSHRAAIEHMARIVACEDIACDFEYLDGYLVCGQQPLQDLQTERWAASRAGLEVRPVAHLPWDGDAWGPGLCFPYQAQLHATRYLHGLATACMRHSVRIFTESHVSVVQCSKTCKAQVQNGSRVAATELVVATNVPITGPLKLRQKAFVTFVVGAHVPKGSVPHALVWDLDQPYHYVRVQPLDDDYDVLLVGGEDRAAGRNPEDDVLRYERLRQWTRERFPVPLTFTYRWSGQVMETLDGLAFLGRYLPRHSNLYLVSGDSGMGMTHGTLGALLITDLIMGRDTPWQGLYDPLRLPLRTVPHILRHEAGQLLKMALTR